jgi:histidinol-phosphate aminotransferase
MSMPFSERAGNSRRQFLRFGATSAAITAAAATGVRIISEPLLAAAAAGVAGSPFPPGSVVINANENPLGPCDDARRAIIDIAPRGGRYSDWLTDEFIETFASQQGLKKEYVKAFPGSSEPLHYSVLAFTSPAKSYVTGDPGYEAGMHAAKNSGARVAAVPLSKTYAHDAAAMVAAAPDAGLFYVCTPNNPSGTVTPHAEIEKLLEIKPKGSVVLVDEAYIHFSDAATALDLVKADKDVVVLRTFSKIYGMAGIRCGVAVARPDLLQKIQAFAGWHMMPVTAVVAATASLKHESLVPERKKINTATRQSTFEWLAKSGYSYVPSETNFFMLDTKRPAKEVIDAMAARKVFIGRVWPVWPTHVRITVGTQDEMERFQDAFQGVMKGTAARIFLPSGTERWTRTADGQRWPEA